MPPAVSILDQIIYNWKYINYRIFNLSASFLFYSSFISIFPHGFVWFGLVSINLVFVIKYNIHRMRMLDLCVVHARVVLDHWLLFYFGQPIDGHSLKQLHSRVIWIWHGWALSMQLTSLITLCVHTDIYATAAVASAVKVAAISVAVLRSVHL